MWELIVAVTMVVVISYPIAIWLDRNSALHTKEEWKEIKRREKTKC